MSASEGAIGTSKVPNPNAARLAIITIVGWPIRSIRAPPSGIVTTKVQETRLIAMPASRGDSPCDISRAGPKLTTRM